MHKKDHISELPDLLTWLRASSISKQLASHAVRFGDLETGLLDLSIKASGVVRHVIQKDGHRWPSEEKSMASHTVDRDCCKRRPR